MNVVECASETRPVYKDISFAVIVRILNSQLEKQLSFSYLCNMNYLAPFQEDIKTLCTKYGVKRLYVFGSVLKEDFNDQSDIDFIADFGKPDLSTYAAQYFGFKFALEDLLNRPVDLLEENAIRNPYFIKSIEPSKQVVYAA
jgi:hypothetical protein